MKIVILVIIKAFQKNISKELLQNTYINIFRLKKWLHKDPTFSIPFFFLFFRATPAISGSSRLGVKSELQLPAYTTATQDPSCVCDLHCSSWQRQILNPLSKARDQTHNLMDTSQVCFH